MRGSKNNESPRRWRAKPLAAHLERVMNGKSDTEMQAWAPQLSALEIAAVITYERNSWGNDTGDLVQPLTVYEAR